MTAADAPARPSHGHELTIENEKTILADLQEMTYEECRLKHGVSRGTVYRIALKYGARKTEQRIKDRVRERRRRQEAFLQEMLGNTVQADVLDFLAEIPDDSISLTVTSCPYNLGIKYGDAAGADRMRHLYFLGWMTMVISEIARVTKPGGVTFLQVGSTKDDEGRVLPMDMLLFESLMKAGLDFQSRVIWTIPHGLTPKRRLAERHETALVFSKGPPAHFNANAARVPQKQPGKRAFKGPNKGKLSGHPLGAAPTDVWDVGNVGHNHKEKSGHPAQFPLELPTRAIQLYTMPGDDVVLDPFCGSGTTQEAALRLGRPFIGADLFYEDLRAKRLKDVGLDNVCRLPGVTEESLAVWQAEARRVDYAADGEPGLLKLCA